jgi:hypothetical protein
MRRGSVEDPNGIRHQISPDQKRALSHQTVRHARWHRLRTGASARLTSFLYSAVLVFLFLSPSPLASSSSFFPDPRKENPRSPFRRLWWLVVYFLFPIELPISLGIPSALAISPFFFLSLTLRQSRVHTLFPFRLSSGILLARYVYSVT